jgi:plastocyanin
MRRMLVLLTAALLAGAGIAGCGDDDDGDGGGDDSAPATETGGDTGGDTGGEEGDGGGGDGERVAITASDFEFAPADLVLTAGEEATLVLGNTGQVGHNLTIEGLDVDEDIEPGGSVDIPLAPDAGEYDFFCAIHAQMQGTLTVD